MLSRGLWVRVLVGVGALEPLDARGLGRIDQHSMASAAVRDNDAGAAREIESSGVEELDGPRLGAING